MSQQELLRKVVELLESNSIGYLLTGSVVSSLQGEPRASHDIDLVVELRTDQVDIIVEAFPQPDYYVTRSSALDAIRRRRMFNLLEVPTGNKVDFWILTEQPFDRSRFARRKRSEDLGVPLWVSAPEDTILMKLAWAAASGGSDKQFGDALRVFEVQGSALDHAYLDDWAERLGVAELWRRLKKRAVPID